MPNRHNRINSFRDLLKINESDIVSSTGISLARLKELEAGYNANISELRDIAANLFTDTKSILGANYFQPQTAIMVDYIESNEDQSYSECVVLCQDNGHIKPLFFSKISKMHKLVAFIPRFA